MITLDQILYVIPILALSASITYYALIIRNQNKTRQAQLYMQIQSKWADREFIRAFYRCLNIYEWDDVDDFWAKYGHDKNEEAFVDVNQVVKYFEGVGQLLRDGLIDFKSVKNLYSYRVIDLWEKAYPLTVYLRERAFGHPNPDYYENFEYLYNELLKHREKHPEI